MQHLQALLQEFKSPQGVEHLIHTHIHKFRQAVFLSIFGLAVNVIGFLSVPGSPAVGTGNLNIRQKLDIQ